MKILNLNRHIRNTYLIKTEMYIHTFIHTGAYSKFIFYGTAKFPLNKISQINLMKRKI